MAQYAYLLLLSPRNVSGMNVCLQNCKSKFYNQLFLTRDPQTPKGTEDRFPGARELGCGKKL